MPFPSFHTFFVPIVYSLCSRGGSATIDELEEAVASATNLSEEQRSQLHGDGPRTEFSYRLAWGPPALNSRPAAPVPSNGATMNNQSCATAPGLLPAPFSAGPIERAGLTDTPVTLMPTIWIATSVRPMAGPRGRVVSAEIANVPAVLAKPTGPARCLAGQDEIERCGAGQRAENLRDRVGDEIADAHPAGNHHPEADRRVDVKTRDRPMP